MYVVENMFPTAYHDVCGGEQLYDVGNVVGFPVGGIQWGYAVGNNCMWWKTGYAVGNKGNKGWSTRAGGMRWGYVVGNNVYVVEDST